MAGDDAAVQRVREATGDRGADVVIETTGMLPPVASASSHVAIGRPYLAVQNHAAKDGSMPFYDLYFKELSLVGARVARSEDYPAAIALVEKGDVRLQPLVSDVMALADLDAAVGMLGSDNGARMKIILEHG
jgi:threonine dehydrogenase-like Zn-dependent dehydrogenase